MTNSPEKRRRKKSNRRIRKKKIQIKNTALTSVLVRSKYNEVFKNNCNLLTATSSVPRSGNEFKEPFKATTSVRILRVPRNPLAELFNDLVQE